MNTLDFLGRIRTRAARRRVESWIEHRRGPFSQHDMDLANQAGASYRSDNNLALAALMTRSSGASTPATTFAGQIWLDTTSGTRKRRNAANTLWIIEATNDETFVIDRSSNTILDESDIGKTFRATASFTQTLTAAATLGDGWRCGYRVEAGATITFDPNASENIDGATTKVVIGPSSGVIVCNGSLFYTVGFVNFVGSPITNSLSGDVALNSAATYFTGPSVAQGTVGTWVAHGTVTITNSATDDYLCKLWDGTTVISSTVFRVGAGLFGSASLSGFITSPAGNIRISVAPGGTNTGTLAFNGSGNSKDCTITAIRIA